MDQVHYVVIVNECHLVTVKTLHAACFELANRDFHLSGPQIELFISELKEVFYHGHNRRVMLVTPDRLDHYLGPLVHQVLVPLELLKLPRVDIIQILSQQLLNDLLLLGLFSLDLQLHQIDLSLVIEQSFEAALS